MPECTQQFVWTPERSQLFRECPRKYYLRWIAPDDENGELLRRRALVTLPQWRRKIIAETLAFALSRYAADGILPDYTALVAHAVELLRAQWRQSRSNIGVQMPSGIILAEHYFDDAGAGIPRETTDALKASIEDALSGFVSSAVVDELVNLPREALLMHDAQASITLDCDGIRTLAQFDSGLIYRDTANKFHVVAWHAGGEERESDSYAMACRIFYTMSHWKQPLDAIVPEAVLLNDGGRSRGYFFSQENLKNIAGMIKSEMRMMRSIDADAFSPTAESGHCEQCLLRALCDG